MTYSPKFPIFYKFSLPGIEVIVINHSDCRYGHLYHHDDNDDGGDVGDGEDDNGDDDYDSDDDDAADEDGDDDDDDDAFDDDGHLHQACLLLQGQLDHCTRTDVPENYSF